MTLPVVLTQDGSITCRDIESGELYHNKVGAYSEALHHYVQVCDLLAHANKQSKIAVLDVCFGLGYNTFVFLDKLIEYIDKTNIKQEQISCHVIGVDRDPEILAIVAEVLKDYRFEQLCSALKLDTVSIENMISNWKAQSKHVLKFNGKVQLTIEIEIKMENLREVMPRLVCNNNRFDYIFHDGFSPRSMPELWTADLFAQYAKLLKLDGRIITYSSAVAVRGALRECNLEVRKSRSLGGKSGGTIAFNPETGEIADGKYILLLSEEEKGRLNSRSSIPYRDPMLNSTRDVIIKRRAMEIRQSLLPTYKSITKNTC